MFGSVTRETSPRGKWTGWPNFLVLFQVGPDCDNDISTSIIKDKFQISIYFVILVLTNEAIVSVTIYVQPEDNAGETDKFVIFEQSSEANSPHPPISHTNKVVMTT